MAMLGIRMVLQVLRLADDEILPDLTVSAATVRDGEFKNYIMLTRMHACKSGHPFSSANPRTLYSIALEQKEQWLWRSNVYPLCPCVFT
jgi:hypothetical protein